MEHIINYLRETYQPLSILLYGSWQDGTNDEMSDFDCMVIVAEKDKKHDHSVIDGVQLDCYIFTAEEVEHEDLEVFLTAYDAVLVEDNGLGEALKNRVRSYVAEHSKLEADEKQLIAAWIRKTIRRMEKADDEGNYRGIALLWESLADYYLLRDRFFFGSKKAVAEMKRTDPKGYALYHRAITEKTTDAIARWGEYVASVIVE